MSGENDTEEQDMSYYRKGQIAQPKTGRAARARHAGTAMSSTRRRAVLAAHITRANSGRDTVSAYLAQLGADAEFCHKYASPFGRAARKEYAEQHDGAAPAQGLSVVSVRGAGAG